MYKMIVLGEFILGEYRETSLSFEYRVNPYCAIKSLLEENNYSNSNDFINAIKYALPMAARFDVRIINNISGKFQIEE